jgi:CheY-like chemotaxis protein
MAGRPQPRRVSRSRRALPALAVTFVCLAASAQTTLSLQELNARKPPDFSPLHINETVQVEGSVGALASHFPGRNLLAIQDAQYGAILETPEGDGRLDGLQPGDRVQVQGTVRATYGMPVIVPETIVTLEHVAPSSPTPVTVADLQGLRYLGRLVRTEGRILEIGDTSGGAFFDLAGPPGNYRVFLPRASGQPVADLSQFSPGDKVRATGIAHQFCPGPPYNRSFELIVNDPGSIARIGRGWFIPPMTLAGATMIVLLAGFFLWSREHRLHRQRERQRRTFQLAEEILEATSAEGVVQRLEGTLTAILGITGVHLYVHNRAAKTLDEVAGPRGQAVSISLSDPAGGAPAGAVACFHYHTLLVIPDIERSPFPVADRAAGKGPRSLLLVPMQAQGEVIGVLELDQDNRTRDFTADEQALAQHLGNQIAVAVRLLDQRSVQEQLFRSEKLAAVGRLISGVVNELRTPLASISDLSARALEKEHLGPAGREIAAIAAEVQKASGMVSRLVSFASGQVEAQPVCINTLLHDLIEFREGDWKATGIRVRDLTSQEPLYVLGSQGQLEQAFLNMLVHAEQSLAEAPQKVLTIRTSVLAKRLVVEIAFSATPESRQAGETASVLGVTRTLLAGHGGEVRVIEKTNADPRFEVELPALARERVSPLSIPETQPAAFSRRMTALVIDADEAAQKQLVGLLAARNCRVVPVDNADTALELAYRMLFDLVFCSMHAPGLNWVELSERMQGRVNAFILLSDGYDAELSADFEGDGRFVLARPVQEPDLSRVLKTIEPRTAVRSGAA